MNIQLLLMETILLWLLSVSSGALQRPDYDDTSTPEFLTPSWMADIPSSRPLSEVTMPGTHNTMALYGGGLAECQSWSLAQQLHAGVRFLDVRVRHVGGNLTIHHGISYQYAHFGDVLQGVDAFLKEHPSETVLMRLREELSETGDIYAAVVRYIQTYARWDLFWNNRRMPTMGEARGKLIVLQNFAGPALGMLYSSLFIADDWQVPSLDYVPQKWKSVYTHLERAQVDEKSRMYLTYSSGASIRAWPYALARRVNPLLYEFLTARVGTPRRFGIITMDFPGAQMCRVIISFNWASRTAA
ncbi:1-phosphatidylinositol phosphodiesterase [Alosa sapidissima]|uniref:1-phosphatidylinositol phosphodiesterase n=1 Tax=Alosa sapidissima TaxID=34773 RepID=UPI001C08938B|nr:1-phosphatidylinositol phosphodiesterase [Alosa sapidissima]XP_041932629.1 1-phosphatidylinositol phosphodiesterase [Alosa sapidissima]XP_041932630.1 1-phosphatidylinositol phosphodiesterase [Alosa sapidissima]